MFPAVKQEKGNRKTGKGLWEKRICSKLDIMDFDHPWGEALNNFPGLPDPFHGFN